MPAGRTRRVLLLAAIALTGFLLPILATGNQMVGAQAAACTFHLGFESLHELMPAVVGECLGDEQHNPENGDGLQQTTTGLLVWRKADNWTAFTDGSTTWINGPLGLVRRPNTGPAFPWEAVAQPVASGIEGQVVLGPTCPGPERPGQVCEQPYPTTVAMFDAQNQPLTSVQTDAQGQFRVSLAPGIYTLRPQVTDSGRLVVAKPAIVTVGAGKYVQIELRVDTGLR